MAGVSVSLSIGGLLLFGTTTSLFAKIVYELQGIGRDGQPKFFQKPWAMTCVMFLGMSCCLPLAYYQQAQTRKKRASAGVDESLLLNGQVRKPHSELREFLLLGIPTAFDLVATILMNIGLLSVTASVYQMMRGAEMLFAALFSVLFLHRSLNKYHLSGIACCVVGIAMVGISSLQSGTSSASHPVSEWQMLAGMALIVASQAVQAAQITFEDFFLSSMDISPLKIVGFEGLWGSAAMVLILLPIVHFMPGKEGAGIHEDTLESLHMIFHSKTIGTILLIDMAALLMYNVAGMCVTGHLGAVFRTVLETMRTLFVWLVDLLLFYTPLGGGNLGESWSKWSFLQAAGFVVLVAGTVIYGKGDEVQQKEELEDLEAAGELPPDSAAEFAASAPMFAPTMPLRSGPMAMGTPSSFKSTMNINSFHRGSLHAAGSYMAPVDANADLDY